PAQLIKADGGEWPDQRESCGEREKDRHHPVTEGHAGQEKADDGIEDAEEDHVSWHCRKIVDTLRDCVPQVCKSDLADDRVCRCLARAADHMESGHIAPP